MYGIASAEVDRYVGHRVEADRYQGAACRQWQDRAGVALALCGESGNLAGVAKNSGLIVHGRLCLDCSVLSWEVMGLALSPKTVIVNL